MHSLVMSPSLHDLIVASFVVKLIGAWFLDRELYTCLLLHVKSPPIYLYGFCLAVTFV